MAEDSGFFSRWSRRKVLAKTGEPLPEPLPGPARPVGAPAASPAPAASTTAGPVNTPAAAGAATAREPAAGAPVPEPAPALTLDDVSRLTPASDFKPFVARTVDPQVRNAAMKTLFSDPHFNVMDGLDIYIDDYSQPNPLPLELARKLTSAQFMKVFDAPESEAGPATDKPAQTLPSGAASSEPALSDAPEAAAALPDARATPDIPPTPAQPAPLVAGAPPTASTA